MHIGEEETERYANHVPGELERLLGEFTDAYEITEELMGQGVKTNENANVKGHTKDGRGEKRKMTKRKTSTEEKNKHNRNKTRKM